MTTHMPSSTTTNSLTYPTTDGTAAPMTDPTTTASVANLATSSEPMISQATSLQMDMSTKIPTRSGSIWKHMGRFSVRVGKFFNDI